MPGRRILFIVTMLVVIAVIVGTFVYLNARRAQQDRQERLSEARQRIRTSLLEIQSIARYQHFCDEGVVRVEATGEFIKLVPSEAGASYRKGDVAFECPSAQHQEDCGIIEGLSFSNVYRCAGTHISAIASDDGGLTVQPQTVGHAVVLDRVILEQQGFVAIYETGSGDNELIARSALLNEGVNDIVSIAIPETLTEEAAYGAALYYDDGDQLFDPDHDTPLTDDSGNLLLASFISHKAP